MFSRAKTKELFAYLIDQRGAMCSMDMIIGNLWQEQPISASKQSQVRSMIADLNENFKKLGIENMLIKRRGYIGVRVEKLNCDYYSYLNGQEEQSEKFCGEYMRQYSFAEVTRGRLDMD